MEMIPVHAGKLRAIGYDAANRVLRVALENGSALEYANVSDSVWRNFKHASAQWSYYRDHIEETFTAKPCAIRHGTGATGVYEGKNPLDDLFG